MLRAVSKPTVDEVTAKATNLGLVVIPSDQHKETLRALNEPTAQELSKKPNRLVTFLFPNQIMKTFNGLKRTLLLMKSNPRLNNLV